MLIRGSILLLVALEASGCVLLPTLSGPPPALEAAPPRAGQGGPEAALRDVRGIIHCHSYLSHDSEGTTEEIAAAARAAGVSFVAMTDHFTPQAVNQGARGLFDGVRFLVGVELSRDHGSILGLGLGEKGPLGARPTPVLDFRDGSDAAILDIHRAGGLAFVGHAEEFEGWRAQGWDGVEVHNLHADASRTRWWTFLLSGLFETPASFLARLIDDPRDVLARWDALGKTRRLPGIGGCDCHASVRLFGPLGGTIGTYPECFRAVTTHVLLPAPAPGRSPPGPPAAEAILEALAGGHAYVAFEIRGDATGFAFEAAAPLRDGLEARVTMGEAAPFVRGTRLAVRTPGGERALVRLYRDGAPFVEAPGNSLEASVPGPGVYRAEVFLDGVLFILSNPIYVR